VRIDFDWDPAKAASNAAKHGVTFNEAMTVFRDPLAQSILDQDSRAVEERWVTQGEQPLEICLWLCTLGWIQGPTVAPCASSRPGGRLRMRRGSFARTPIRERSHER